MTKLYEVMSGGTMNYRTITFPENSLFVVTGGADIKAPVAGTLLRYEVAEGAQVKADTTVIMIESMKMELEIKAGASGAVHFLVQPGTQITAGQALAEIK